MALMDTTFPFCNCPHALKALGKLLESPLPEAIGQWNLWPRNFDLLFYWCLRFVWILTSLYFAGCMTNVSHDRRDLHQVTCNCTWRLLWNSAWGVVLHFNLVWCTSEIRSHKPLPSCYDLRGLCDSALVGPSEYMDSASYVWIVV